MQHHVLIFDNHCPLCRAYTGAFIKTGMLDARGREAYGELNSDTCQLLDMDRARNEIALVNTKTGQVLYGIDSLFRVLGHAFPVFAPLFRFRPFRWLMKKIYSFISYNRKVIVPSNAGADHCVPDFSTGYRWAYILFAWLLTSAILTAYSTRLDGLLPASRFFREFMVCGGQILFQSCALYFIKREKLMTYLGNMMTISLAGGLVLLLAMVVGSLAGLHAPLVYALLFLTTAGIMFLEHWRRMKLLDIHWSASLSWVLYRVFILIFII